MEVNVASSPHAINSDTVTPAASPFPKDSGSFVVRSIKRAWNHPMGHEQWELHQHCTTNGIKDKRCFVIAQNSELFRLIVAADPRVPDMVRDTERDLLPTYRVSGKQTGMYLYTQKWEAINMGKAEMTRKEHRVYFDDLHDLRTSLGMGRAEADAVIRSYLFKDRWYEQAKGALYSKYRSTHPMALWSIDMSKTVLDAWFPRDKDGKPVDDDSTDKLMARLSELVGDDEKPDELTTPEVKHWSQDGSLYSAIAPLFVKRQKSAVIKDYMQAAKTWYGVQSFTEIEISKEEFLYWLIDELSRRYDENENATEAPKNDEKEDSRMSTPETTKQSASTPSDTQNPVSTTALPEAPFSSNFKLIHKSGVEIQFTIRAASGAEGMPQIDAAITYLLDHGYTTRQQQQALPSNATPITSAPSAAAAQPAQSGAKPMLTEQVVKVVREADPKSRMVYTGLYTLFGSAPGQYATYKIKDSDANRLAALNAATGMNWASVPLFTEQVVNLTAQYTESDKKNASGNAYHDLVTIAPAA